MQNPNSGKVNEKNAGEDKYEQRVEELMAKIQNELN